MSYKGGSYLWGYPADGAEPTNGYSVRYNSTLKKWELFSPATIPAGTDQQVLQFNGVALTAQDLIIASKSVDNTTIPTDGQVLTYDSASGKVKFKTVSNPSMGDFAQLQAAQDAGNLVVVTGEKTGIGEIVSYVPANGKKFYIFKAQVGVKQVDADNFGLELKNDATTKEKYNMFSAASGNTNLLVPFVTEGDSLTGDGAKKYALNSLTHSTNNVYDGTLVGVIA